MSYPKIEKEWSFCTKYDYGNNLKKYVYDDQNIYWVKEIVRSNGSIDEVKHNLNGPAIARPDKHQSWWINGKQINCSTQEEFNRIIKLLAFS